MSLPPFAYPLFNLPETLVHGMLQAVSVFSSAAGSGEESSSAFLISFSIRVKKGAVSVPVVGSGFWKMVPTVLASGLNSWAILLLLIKEQIPSQQNVTGYF